MSVSICDVEGYMPKVFDCERHVCILLFAEMVSRFVLKSNNARSSDALVSFVLVDWLFSIRATVIKRPWWVQIY